MTPEVEQVRREVEAERAELTGAVDSLVRDRRDDRQAAREAADPGRGRPRRRFLLPAASARRCACSPVVAGRGGQKLGSAASPLSTATDGRAPSGPERLSDGREWLAAFKRTAKQFLADDCMGLSQQVAYSSLLAFFPAVDLPRRPARPDRPLRLACRASSTRSRRNRSPTSSRALQQDSEAASGTVAAVVLGAFGAVWAASGAVGTVDQGRQPRVRPGRDASVLEGTADLDRARRWHRES